MAADSDRNEGETDVIQWPKHVNSEQTAKRSTLLLMQIQYLKELLNMKRKGMSADDIHTKLVSLQEEN